MLAVSVIQPWAWLIVHGYKPVDNRKEPHEHRGPTLIHAGQKFDQAGYDLVRECYPEIPMPAPDAFPKGGIVGVATITDCVTRLNSSWFFGPYGFLLEDAKPLPLVPFRGQLGFFNVPDKALADPRAAHLSEPAEAF
ncbi:ASCH domain-containing protein [Pseudoxanthomonas sp. PXM04]|uniref:ASCH domain-containing protein n=1 Tax=Pseudoxanthomonas sp. PXM04 TaxID=2769297 RepID=UPI001782C257|nr:ASCH domain-containing protein [Pseudoxanthomonas sp. PXM04]MBD9376159.1 ASCH domain-containing protein [Pseudoxanthomonas sp. PXM04]